MLKLKHAVQDVYRVPKWKIPLKVTIPYEYSIVFVQVLLLLNDTNTTVCALSTVLIFLMDVTLEKKIHNYDQTLLSNISIIVFIIIYGKLSG